VRHHWAVLHPVIAPALIPNAFTNTRVLNKEERTKRAVGLHAFAAVLGVSRVALILKKKESSFRKWYQQNKERLSQERKQRYAQDSEYRQRAVEASRRRRRGESIPTMPPSVAPISLKEAAERIGVGVSTLSSWRTKQYFPAPTLHSGRLWFAERQVCLLRDLKEKMHGRHRWYMKTDRFTEVIAHVRDKCG